MIIKYEKEKRKSLVEAISEFTGEDAKYLGTPSFAYEIKGMEILKDGFLDTKELAKEDVIELINHLEEKGFKYSNKDEIQRYKDSTSLSNEPQIANFGDEIRVKAEDLNLVNIYKLIQGKRKLIKKSLNIEKVPIINKEDTVIFPWLDENIDEKEIKIYERFIKKLCNFSLKAKRVTMREKESKNEKYDFRVFLIRLGYVGDEYKEDRKVLLQNLSGNSAFKSLKNEEKMEDDVSR